MPELSSVADARATRSLAARSRWRIAMRGAMKSHASTTANTQYAAMT
jgi:hypothetical protein